MTLRNLSSDFVLALALPDLLLSEFPVTVSECLWMLKATLLSELSLIFLDIISLEDRPMS